MAQLFSVVNPLNVSYSEVYSTLQLKQIDGDIQPLFAHEEMSFYELQDYFTNSFEMPLIVTALAANLDWYNSLTSEQKQTLSRAVTASVSYTIDEADKMNADCQAKMQKARPNLVFYELTHEEQAPFRAKAAEVEKIYVKMAGPEAPKLLDTLKAEKEALENARK